MIQYSLDIIFCSKIIDRLMKKLKEVNDLEKVVDEGRT